jgi:hypothetical protein
MEHQGVRYTIRAGIEPSVWFVAIHPGGVESPARAIRLTTVSKVNVDGRAMPKGNNSTNEDRFARQDQRAYRARSSLVIVAIIVIIIGVGFFMLFAH